MKHIKTHSAKRMAMVTGAVLVAGVIHLFSSRLDAQESTPPPGGNDGGPTFPGGRTGPPSGRSRSPGMMSSRLSKPTSQPPIEIAPARFEATVYEVQVPEQRIADLDAPAFEAKASTAQALAKALAEFGKVKVLYKIDQTVNLYGESIMLSTSEPMVTGTHGRESGPSMNSITYMEAGLIVNLSASAPPEDPPGKELCVQANFELSALADSAVEIAPQVKATSIRKMDLRHSETPRFGKPLVLLNVSAPGGGDQAQPVAYVIRYVFSEIKR